MERGWQGFSGGLPPVPRATRMVLALFVAASLVNVLASQWLQLGRLSDWLELMPSDVLHGQVWRLVTYPIVAVDPLGLLFGAMLLVFVGGALESRWGSRRFVVRTLLLAALPALLTTLLSLVLTGLQGRPYIGLGPLSMGYITAFACMLRHERITLFPIPLVLSGDQLLWFEGGLLLLWMLFAGTTAPFVPEVLAFGVGLAWFRFGWVERLRRLFSRGGRGGGGSGGGGRAESRLEQLARRRRLRLVRPDEGDDPQDPPSRLLH